MNTLITYLSIFLYLFVYITYIIDSISGGTLTMANGVGTIIAAVISGISLIISTRVGIKQKKIDALTKDEFLNEKKSLAEDHKSLLQGEEKLSHEHEELEKYIEQRIYAKIEKMYENMLRNEKDFERLCNSAGSEIGKEVHQSIQVISALENIIAKQDREIESLKSKLREKERKSEQPYHEDWER